jgi:DNA polymerase-3 subunit delta'
MSENDALDERRRELHELSLLSGATVTDRLDASARLAKMFTDARADLYRLLDTWEGWWRDLLLTAAGAKDFVQNIDQIATLDSQSARIDPRRALEAVSLIQQTRKQLQENVNPRLALEALTLGLP